MQLPNGNSPRRPTTRGQPDLSSAATAWLQSDAAAEHPDAGARRQQEEKEARVSRTACGSSLYLAWFAYWLVANLGWLPGMMRPGEPVTIDRRPYRKHGNTDQHDG
jgi:hypothetical protein